MTRLPTWRTIVCLFALAPFSAPQAEDARIARHRQYASDIQTFATIGPALDRPDVARVSQREAKRISFRSHRGRREQQTTPPSLSSVAPPKGLALEGIASVAVTRPTIAAVTHFQRSSNGPALHSRAPPLS